MEGAVKVKAVADPREAVCMEGAVKVKAVADPREAVCRRKEKLSYK